MTTISEETFVFNVVWTGSVFTYLRYFVASQIAQSSARFRFVANGCPPSQIGLMEKFRAQHPDRVVEVLKVRDRMEGHGVALDATYDQRDDGEYFSLIDADILARGPFLQGFVDRLRDGNAAVTSGRGIWLDDDVLPKGRTGVSGEYFYAPDGYLFGSPHFAIYRRALLDQTRRRWNIGFQSAGPGLTDEAKERLVAIKRRYVLYDTAKVVNIFLQEDGNRLCHFEEQNIMHIGGLSHFLFPTPDAGDDDAEKKDFDWSTAVEARYHVSQFTASVLRDLIDGRPAPPLPDDVDPAMRDRLVRVREALIELMDRYRSW